MMEPLALRTEADIELEEPRIDDGGVSGGIPGNIVPGPSARMTRTMPRPERSETGVWIGVSAIMMTFAAFTSAMIVRQGASNDWAHFQLPRILYLNTFILLASSVTLGVARWRFSALSAVLEQRRSQAQKLYADGLYWLYVTAALGVTFVVGQILAWKDLVAQGLLLATNPSSSFFYVFTALHGLHLLGGIGGLFYIIHKLGKTSGTAQTTGLGAVCVYWHFMDGLWVYLFLLLAMRT
ncbi:MAG: cytochrome c oxidase subunit 3 [Candidatus Acidiferrales bacterium]